MAKEQAVSRRANLVWNRLSIFFAEIELLLDLAEL
jgi:hypothetical protein